jgi:hypothetical protein
MFKKFALAAMAAVSTCAFAQTWNPSMDPSNMSAWDQKKMVMDQANAVLLGGDAYLMSNLLDRASTPANVAVALASSLSKNYYQSRIIGYEIAMSRYPVQTSYTTTVTNPDGTVTTTTTTDYSTTYAESMRPMRMIMEVPFPNRNITYDDALNILCANLDTAECTQVRDWWWNRSSEQDKDVIVRFLRADSRYADTIIYPSTFPHSTITTSGAGG